MKLVHNERNGEAFDSQLVIGVRESYVNLCSNPQGKYLLNNIMRFHLPRITPSPLTFVRLIFLHTCTLFYNLPLNRTYRQTPHLSRKF